MTWILQTWTLPANSVYEWFISVFYFIVVTLFNDRASWETANIYSKVLFSLVSFTRINGSKSWIFTVSHTQMAKCWVLVLLKDLNKKHNILGSEHNGKSKNPWTMWEHQIQYINGLQMRAQRFTWAEKPVPCIRMCAFYSKLYLLGPSAAYHTARQQEMAQEVGFLAFPRSNA